MRSFSTLVSLDMQAGSWDISEANIVTFFVFNSQKDRLYLINLELPPRSWKQNTTVQLCSDSLDSSLTAWLIRILGAKMVTQSRKRLRNAAFMNHELLQASIHLPLLPRYLFWSSFILLVYTFLPLMQCLQCMLELQECKPKRGKG